MKFSSGSEGVDIGGPIEIGRGRNEDEVEGSGQAVDLVGVCRIDHAVGSHGDAFFVFGGVGAESNDFATPLIKELKGEVA
jgi:hypothetical protein